MEKQTHAELVARLAGPERENARLKQQLAREDALWSTELGRDRHSSGLPVRMLHAHETLDAIIAAADGLRALTGIPPGAVR